ncbi:MAG TPA: DNA-binding protein [Wolbachia sp.]|uniref:helix-turn-helix domain-containing protein n=1 Tax=Wolbachia endosymbiont of Pentalonia nigronervosa TaxID=1301914 RepID=UPI000EEC97DF|nr:helix-turn-helix transcriptional regulator [Wolbachia endosymbiont of Pentalonia nigronervosa]MBD0391087.1 XRE family transcriptional regulator [Wolbachia endosymbiont of Pentalonia nigronervosa]HCE59406.1 DNA-binding protein [Wolbachia sp.]
MEIISLNSLGSIEIKKKLLDIIRKVIEKNTWTQSHAAERLGIDQPKVSQIKNGKIDGFSLERLLVFLKKLNHKITITIAEGQVSESETKKFKQEAEH